MQTTKPMERVRNINGKSNNFYKYTEENDAVEMMRCRYSMR